MRPGATRGPGLLSGVEEPEATIDEAPCRVVVVVGFGDFAVAAVRVVRHGMPPAVVSVSCLRQLSTSGAMSSMKRRIVAVWRTVMEFRLDSCVQPCTVPNVGPGWLSKPNWIHSTAITGQNWGWYVFARDGVTPYVYNGLKYLNVGTQQTSPRRPTSACSRIRWVASPPCRDASRWVTCSAISPAWALIRSPIVNPATAYSRRIEGRQSAARIDRFLAATVLTASDVSVTERGFVEESVIEDQMYPVRWQPLP